MTLRQFNYRLHRSRDVFRAVTEESASLNGVLLDFCNVYVYERAHKSKTVHAKTGHMSL